MEKMSILWKLIRILQYTEKSFSIFQSAPDCLLSYPIPVLSISDTLKMSPQLYYPDVESVNQRFEETLRATQRVERKW